MRLLVLLVGLFIAAPLCGFAQEAQDNGVEVHKIWDAAPHNAFTDLIRWKGRFYCTFRESTHHVPTKRTEDGKIRVIASDDGKTWESVALLSKEMVDLRDSKLSITPDGRLMAIMGGSYYTFDGKRKRVRMAPQVAFMSDPEKGFGPVTAVEIDPNVQSENDWLWRVTWKDGVGYGVLYQPDYTKKDNGLHLLKTTDGVRYDLVKTLNRTGRVGETTVRFDPDGQIRLFVRSESGDRSGYLGRAKAPYTGDCTWKKIDIHLGGPDAILLPNGTWILGTRYYGPKVMRTVLARIDDQGHTERMVEFPSGGDTSYPGMLIHDGKLWVSYYSSHEGKTSIYLAVVPLELL